MQKLKKLKHIFVVVVLALSVVFGSLFIPKEYTDIFNGTFIYRTGNNTWQDRIYAHTIRPSDDIAIIRIDNASINALQAKGGLKMLNIPKIQYGLLVEKLEAAGIKGIAFDIIFENEDNEEEKFLTILKKYKNIVIASEYGEDKCAPKLEAFIQSNRTQIVGNTRKDTTINSSGGVLEPNYKTSQYSCVRSFIKILKLNWNLLDESEKKKYEWVKDVNVDDASKWKQEYVKKILCEKSENNGYENCPGVPRSIYRDIPWGLVTMDDTSGYERTTYADIGAQPYASWFMGTGSTMKMDNLIVDTLPLALYVKTVKPGSSNPYVTLLRDYKLNPYFGGEYSYPSLSFIDALEMSRVSAMKTFSGKYVFIGESGTAIHDSIVSPVTGNRMDGVETHAHYLDGLLQNKMLDRAQEMYYFGTLIGFTCVMTILYFLLPGIFSLLLALILPLGILYLTRYAYDLERTLIDIVPLLLAGTIATFPITFIYKFFVVDREKRQLKNNFAHYIDPHVVDEIAKRGDSIELGGEKKNLTVLFSDIAGFTTISEKLDPRDLFYLMTSYLSRMTDILIREGGTLDKYIGDAVMGFFGAPKSYDDHAIRAAETALRMQDALPAFNESIAARDLDPIDFRVGIATGEVMVGNIGSHDRFNYTVLGDTVNLASRLESAGKEYGVNIIISHGTKLALTPHYFARELDTIAVKGKTEGIKIYELVGYSEDYVERTKYIVYERALGLYRAGDYREAGKLWQTQIEIDPPSRIMMLRCVEAIKGNVNISKGVFIMDHK